MGFVVRALLTYFEQAGFRALSTRHAIGSAATTSWSTVPSRYPTGNEASLIVSPSDTAPIIVSRYIVGIDADTWKGEDTSRLLRVSETSMTQEGTLTHSRSFGLF